MEKLKVVLEVVGDNVSVLPLTEHMAPLESERRVLQLENSQFWSFFYDLATLLETEPKLPVVKHRIMQLKQEIDTLKRDNQKLAEHLERYA